MKNVDYKNKCGSCQRFIRDYERSKLGTCLLENKPKGLPYSRPKCPKYIFDKTVYCQQCDTFIFDGWNYCPDCGTKIPRPEEPPKEEK